MELLLILSAMLSAVTGAFSGVGGPESRLPHAEAAVGARVAAAAVEQQAPKALAERPAEPKAEAHDQPLPELAVAPAVPLYADRLIE